jgi:hypothetical protein
MKDPTEAPEEGDLGSVSDRRSGRVRTNAQPEPDDGGDDRNAAERHERSGPTLDPAHRFVRHARCTGHRRLADAGREPGLAQLGPDLGNQPRSVTSPAVQGSFVRWHRTECDPCPSPGDQCGLHSLGFTT